MRASISATSASGAGRTSFARFVVHHFLRRLTPSSPSGFISRGHTRVIDPPSPHHEARSAGMAWLSGPMCSFISGTRR